MVKEVVPELQRCDVRHGSTSLQGLLSEQTEERSVAVALADPTLPYSQADSLFQEEYKGTAGREPVAAETLMSIKRKII